MVFPNDARVSCDNKKVELLLHLWNMKSQAISSGACKEDEA